MTVEAVTYISDLDSTYPAGTDEKREGDNHIRNIKAALLASFPNFAGAAMTSTEAELNLLDGSIAGTAVASKALVLGATKNIDTIDVATDGLKLNGTAITATAAELNTLDGITSTVTELNYVSGVTSAIQTQIDNVVQVVSDNVTAYSSYTGIIDYDDTIPQVTEGDQLFSCTITPKSASSKLEIECVLHYTGNSSRSMIMALFQDGGANAIAATARYTNSSSLYMYPMVLKYVMTAGTVSSTTFTIRAGQNLAATYYVNGLSTGRVLGGVLVSSMTVREINGNA